jgi:protease-4
VKHRPPNARPMGRRSRFVIRNSPFVIRYALFALLTGCAPMSFLITPVPEKQDLVERELSRDSVWHNDKVALIDLDGVLRNQRETPLLGRPGENPVSLFKEKLDKAGEDDSVKAIVLRINSPGGGVTASDLMYMEVLRFKAATGKPVIAAMLDLGTSGAYYIACAADQIYAHPTTVTGSIGVIMVAPDFSGAMHKLGIRANIIKSADLKDAGSPFREMNEADRAIFQTMIDAMYARFLNVVATSRSMIDEALLKQLADGRVYLAPQAKQYGLIDELGTLHDALNAAKQAAGLDGKPIVVVEYARPLAHRPNVYARATDVPAQVNLVNVELPAWLEGSAPSFMYLWAPGYAN